MVLYYYHIIFKMTLEERLQAIEEKRKLHPKKPWHKSFWGRFLLLILFLLVSFLLASLFYIYQTAKNLKEEKAFGEDMKQNQANKELLENALLKSPYLGNANASLVIVEFSDFACPGCQQCFTYVRELAQKYPEEIKIVHRDFLGHENSLDLAMAARCAKEQNKFWEMNDTLFINQGAISKENISEYAKQIGLNLEKFNDCYGKNLYGPHIFKDYEDAKALSVSATPTWFINGYKTEGCPDKEIFFYTIESFLKP